MTRQFPIGGELAETPSPPVGTPLHYAAFCGLRDVVEILAIEHPQDVNSRSFDDESIPLNLASQEGHGEIVRILVEHGADVAAQEKDGSTPLHWASQRGHVEVARILENGADAAAPAQSRPQTNSGSTPLHRAS